MEHQINNMAKSSQDDVFLTQLWSSVQMSSIKITMVANILYMNYVSFVF